MSDYAARNSRARSKERTRSRSGDAGAVLANSGKPRERSITHGDSWSKAFNQAGIINSRSATPASNDSNTACAMNLDAKELKTLFGSCPWFAGSLRDFIVQLSEAESLRRSSNDGGRHAALCAMQATTTFLESFPQSVFDQVPNGRDISNSFEALTKALVGASWGERPGILDALRTNRLSLNKIYWRAAALACVDDLIKLGRTEAVASKCVLQELKAKSLDDGMSLTEFKVIRGNYDRTTGNFGMTKRAQFHLVKAGGVPQEMIAGQIQLCLKRLGERIARRRAGSS